MNPQETRQVVARDEKWVPSTERVKISSTNAFTITTKVPEIFMQQFWYTIKKVKDSESYEFLLANKKCIVDAEVFRKILDIYPRVEGEEFTPVQDDDTLTFLTDLGYKGPLHKYTNMYVDHMHQPWRTLAAIIKKCISRKTASNDRLRKSRIDILKERKSRRETMPFPRFTKVIINHFLSQHKSLSNLKYQHYHTIKDDGIVSLLKFVRIGEDYQEYELAIPDMMLNDAIKESESYQMFIKYSTSQIPPKKSKGKGSQGKKTADTPVADVDVSKESDSEPARKRTASRRVVKKKVTLSTTNNIIPDADVALELGKSISLTEAAEEEAARQVHATHARIVTESDLDPAKKKTGSRSTRGVVIQDTPSAPKTKPASSKLKIKGVQSLTPKEQEAADVMQALKESKKTSKRQPVVFATSSEGTSTKPEVPDEEKVTSKEKVILKWGSEQESEYLEEDQGDDEEIDWIDSDEDEEKKDDIDDDKSINLEMTDDEETDDEFVHGVEQVNDDKDEEMTNDEVEESGNFSTVKDTTDAEINSLLDIKIQYEVPHIQSPSVLRVPVSVISEPSVLTHVQETPSVALVTTLPPPSVSIIPPVPHQTIAPIHAPPIIIDAPTITTAISESDALFAVQLRVAKLEKDVSELKKIDHSTKALATLKSQVPTVVEQYIESKIGDDLQKVLQRHTADLIQKYSVKPTLESSKIQTPIINLEQEYEKSASEILKIKKEQAEKQKMPKYTIKSTDKVALKEYDQKSALYQTMHENKSFNRNLANHRFYHALMEALIEDENAMDKGVVDTVKDHKRKHDDDDDKYPPARPNQGKKTKRRRTKKSESSKKPSTTKETPKGKAPSKSSKISKSASAKEPVEELIAEVVMDDAVNTAGEDVVRDDDQPQVTSEPKTDKNSNPEWFKQPPRPATLDPEWNKRQVVLGQPEQPWFNQMVSTTKDPLIFNDLMATPIDFSKYVLNRLKIDNLTQDLLLGPAYNLLKDTCSNNIELEYNFQECHPGHLTIAADYFFNNDLEYLKSSNLERTYTTSITKTKATRYKIVEVVVKIVDQQLYKFKEGDFVDLHLNEIEDMLILAVQHKLFHLNDSDILGVENYQKKLNITAPQQTFPEIEFKELYTPSYKPPGNTQFSSGYDEEISRRKWTATDKRRSDLMVELIDKQMRERQIIRNLERLVGARELEMDYKLMTHLNGGSADAFGLIIFPFGVVSAAATLRTAATRLI
ncbi:hypothetical protein Tco_1057337 [Tanacetum coccineum]|uniref:Uncharacterized protein n=1 Tax=Tanacetum coccineum TaxID=301880 RepID=A0ABQ5H6J2_9ASTR